MSGYFFFFNNISSAEIEKSWDEIMFGACMKSGSSCANDSEENTFPSRVLLFDKESRLASTNTYKGNICLRNLEEGSCKDILC